MLKLKNPRKENSELKLVKPDNDIVRVFCSFWTPNPEETEIQLFEGEEKIDVSEYIKDFEHFDENDKTIQKKENLEDFLKGINGKYGTGVKKIDDLVKALNNNYNIHSQSELKEKIGNEEISLIDFVRACKDSTGRYEYSFSTKVFSFIDEKYPIVDKYAVTILDSYTEYHKIPKSKWGNYDIYCENYRHFIDGYDLKDECSYKDIDKFLWTYGKMLDDYWLSLGRLRFESFLFDVNMI